MEVVELILGAGAFGAARVQSWRRQRGWGPSVWVSVWWAPGAADPNKPGVHPFMEQGTECCCLTTIIKQFFWGGCNLMWRSPACKLPIPHNTLPGAFLAVINHCATRSYIPRA